MSHTIYVVSGGAGTSGEQLVHTVLAQFPESQVRAVVFPHVRTEDQLVALIAGARQEEATVVHTLVDASLRSTLVQHCEQQGVIEIDLMGSLIDHLQGLTGASPLGKPGLYRQLKRDYFERVAAIEYSMAHDDGKDPEGWGQADVLLTGVSRVGKTPLSLYLSVLGWKAANYPLVMGVDPPQALQSIDPGRVIGLTIEPGQLVTLRLERQRRMGAGGAGSYSDPRRVYEEVEFARKYCRQHGFNLIDVTDKPLESTADEVIRLISARYGARARDSEAT